MTVPAPAEPKRRILGFCWFRRETYERARSVMSDPEILFDSFDEWLVAARRIERGIARRRRDRCRVLRGGIAIDDVVPFGNEQRVVLRQFMFNRDKTKRAAAAGLGGDINDAGTALDRFAGSDG